MLKDFLIVWLTVLGIAILAFGVIVLVVYLAAFVNFFLGAIVGLFLFSGFLAAIAFALFRRM